MSGQPYQTNGTTVGPTHTCNCIGCCRKCGRCRTAPWHAASCDRIAALNAEAARVVRDAAEN